MRARIARGELPQLTIWRGVDIEPVAALALSVRGATLVADELDLACRDKRWLSPSVKHIVHYSRHLRTDLFGTFRSTRNVSEDLLHAADFVFLHHHSEAGPYDLQTVRQRFGDRMASAVQALKPMEFVVWSDA